MTEKRGLPRGTACETGADDVAKQGNDKTSSCRCPRTAVTGEAHYTEQCSYLQSDTMKVPSLVLCVREARLWLPISFQAVHIYLAGSGSVMATELSPKRRDSCES